MITLRCTRKLLARLRAALSMVLVGVGVSPAVIERELEALAEVQLAATRSASSSCRSRYVTSR
ncbi:MAG: hypothetical protein WCK73_03555 [Deltaproteobacteria bacterium]